MAVRPSGSRRGAPGRRPHRAVSTISVTSASGRPPALDANELAFASRSAIRHARLGLGPRTSVYSSSRCWARSVGSVIRGELCQEHFQLSRCFASSEARRSSSTSSRPRAAARAASCRPVEADEGGGGDPPDRALRSNHARILQLLAQADEPLRRKLEARGRLRLRVARALYRVTASNGVVVRFAPIASEGLHLRSLAIIRPS